MLRRLAHLLCTGVVVIACAGAAAPASAQSMPHVHRTVSIGPQTMRIIVGFRSTATGAVERRLQRRPGGAVMSIREALTDAADVQRLARRAHVPVQKSRQLTASTHLLILDKTLYGADVAAALDALRADPAVRFADVDQRRFVHAVSPVLPNDPLFTASGSNSGQWYLLTPDLLTPGGDAAATDTVSAWSITTGSTGTVIADIDTGVLFDHPDLKRAGFGGRLLPGYDFVSEDLDPKNSTPLGTYLIANDGDGWDPDPSDPGDWISTTDQANAVFPADSCSLSNSSWHGTRVMGILGALTDNATGVAGMTWNTYLLPVRALGKCGGYDSDIITAMQWAAGLSVTGVPDNPFPADIINLSLGGSGSCPTTYADVISTLNTLGVLIVASAGNAGGAVDAPANCANVLSVAGLRNVGTKVGYSSLGAQVTLAAPAGNCVSATGLPCLRSLDTTTDAGSQSPTSYTYTNESNPNLGTSFSAPIVSGIAALMRAVNANLTPAQMIARMQSSATPFPQPSGVPVCPTINPTSGECACPNDGSQCGAGMANALAAVLSARRPIAAVALPASTVSGEPVALNAGGSAAACGRTIAAYSWSASPATLIVSGADTATVTVLPTAAGTLTLTVTDSENESDSATLTVAADGTIDGSAATPASAGTAATACPASLSMAPAAPVVAESFAPASVGTNAVSTLTVVLSNSNAYALTGATLSGTLPANLHMPTGATSVPTTTCGGAEKSLQVTATTWALSGANIPAAGSCQITVPVQSAAVGTYTNLIASNALSTGPAGGNASAATAVLTVTAPSGGGGGALDWWDTLFVVGVLLAGRRHMRRR